MDKYKYVDGVKYKVVPNSALGYNLVPVEEGGGEGGGGNQGVGKSIVYLPYERANLSQTTLNPDIEPAEIESYISAIADDENIPVLGLSYFDDYDGNITTYYYINEFSTDTNEFEMRCFNGFPNKIMFNPETLIVTIPND